MKLKLIITTIIIAFTTTAVKCPATEGCTLTTSPSDTETTTIADVEDDGCEWDFWWSAGANITSNYMWRGYDQSYYGNMFDPAIQPSVTLGFGAFYVDLWYNYSTASTYQEFDMTLGFDYKNLSITLYDVWCDYGKAFWQNDFLDDKNHSLTATIEYTLFDRLRLHWGTTFLHASDWLYNADGSKRRRAFSSYFEVEYTQPVKGLFDISVAAGASPWTGPFWTAGPQILEDGEYLLEYDAKNPPVKGFNVTNLSLMLTKEFEVGAASIPLNVGYIYNPTSKRHYALIKTGISF